MEFVTVEGVELASAGMEWPASSGPFTVTLEHLADIVVAANEDPHIQIPRIKLGHYSEVNGSLRVVDPFEEIGDAEPSFGRAANLRLENDGAVLVGDFIEMPAWLADGLPSYYASRSCEWQRSVTTPGGKSYSMVITAVALLGVELPAIQDLEDLARLLVEGPPQTTATATRDPHEEDRMPPEQTETSVSAGTIRERFNFDWAMNSDSVFEDAEGDTVDPYWWWARDIRLDPNEVIADDPDRGTIWSVPFTTDGADQVNFGEPVRVREEFIPVSTTAETAAAAVRERTGQQVIATNLERPEKPERSQTAARPEEEDAMPSIDISKLRERLGLSEEQLPDDATEEQINEALAAEETPETPETPEETPEQPETPESPEAPETPESPEESPGEPAAATSGMTPEHFQQLTEDARLGREARTEQVRTERERYIETAVKAGKFAPAVATSYRQQLDKGGEIERTTREFIDGLPENVVPVEALGEAGSTPQADMDRIMASFGHKKG